jgi:pilus assembly protein CpaF
VTIRELVKNSLRMRPDRIVVGEVRGGEALDMLQAMNTGHDGSLTTVHANTPRDALSRIETLVLMAGMDLPLKVVRQQVSSAVDLIVQQTRLKDGQRKVTAVTEVAGMEGDIIILSDIFKFNQSGVTADGKVLGEVNATGIRPNFTPRLEAAGFRLGAEVFAPKLSANQGNRR